MPDLPGNGLCELALGRNVALTSQLGWAQVRLWFSLSMFQLRAEVLTVQVPRRMSDCMCVQSQFTSDVKCRKEQYFSRM